MADALSLISTTMILACWALWVLRQFDFIEMSACLFYGLISFAYTGSTIASILDGELFSSILFGVVAVVAAWTSWNDRNKRNRKKALKLLGDKSKALRTRLLKSLKPSVVLRPVPQSV